MDNFAVILSESSASVLTVTQGMYDIADAAKEQSAASNEIAKNIANISQSTEDNSSSVDQAAMAHKLKGTISMFKV